MGSFSADSVRIAGTLARFAGFALGEDVTDLALRLHRALARRAVISEAQSVLMARLHCPSDQAFVALVGLAEEQGVQLHEAARTVVGRPA